MASEMTSKKLKKVLWIPAWFPHQNDEQLGNFYYQKAQAISSQVELVVVTFNRNPPAHFSYDFDWINFQAQKGGRLIAILRWYRYLKQIITSVHCVHVFSYSPIFRLLPRLVKNQSVPFFFTEHWHGILTKDTSGISDRAFFLEKAHKIFVPSIEMSKALKEKGFETSEVIPNIISVGVKKEAPDSDMQPYALMIADMVDEIKGIGRIVDAWQSLDTKMNLLLIGDGPDFLSLQQKAEKSKNIIFLGRKDQPTSMAYLHHAAFLIQNSRLETFGMVPLEALACGKPIVYRNVGVLKEMDLKRAGIEINSSGEAVAIDEMLNSYSKYSSNDLKEMVREYSEENIVSKLISHYLRVN